MAVFYVNRFLKIYTKLGIDYITLRREEKFLLDKEIAKRLFYWFSTILIIGTFLFIGRFLFANGSIERSDEYKEIFEKLKEFQRKNAELFKKMDDYIKKKEEIDALYKKIANSNKEHIVYPTLKRLKELVVNFHLSGLKKDSKKGKIKCGKLLKKLC